MLFVYISHYTADKDTKTEGITFIIHLLGTCNAFVFWSAAELLEWFGKKGNKNGFSNILVYQNEQPSLPEALLLGKTAVQ